MAARTGRTIHIERCGDKSRTPSPNQPFCPDKKQGWNEDDQCLTPRGNDQCRDYGNPVPVKGVKLVFYQQARGLPSLQRGWRTPDPSPTRTGLPKCAAYKECLILEPERHDKPPEPSVKVLTDETSFLKPPTNLFQCSPCRWADIPAEEGMEATFEVDPTQPIASKGSMGHPYACNEACKYAKKTRGCKDGASCDRCHLCEWKRPVKKTVPKSA